MTVMDTGAISPCIGHTIMSDRPKPFSSEWLTAPAMPPEPPKRLNKRTSQGLVAALSWLPGERLLSVLVVTFLILTSFWLGTPAGKAVSGQPLPGAETPVAGLVFDDVPEPEQEQPDISTDSLTVTEDDEGEGPGASGQPAESTPEGPKLTLNLPQEEAVDDGSLLPKHRLLLFYGFPGNEDMGVLGEYDMQRLLEMLQETAAEYEAVDPSRPVKIAFEVIASVAQAEPQTDGSFLLDAPSALLDEYTNFAEANDMLIFFDVQIGRRKVSTEVEGLRPWLEKPFVHLALDPEFAMREGQIPGDHIGQIDGSDVTWTQNYLADLSREMGIPPKVLVVHQFKHSMIENKDTIAPVPGVQLVIDMDGWGPPDLKRGTYSAVISQEPIEFNGIKLFYKQDDPLMTPAEILELDPVPDLIIYQ
jgi:hypothetical protein